ncbi:MAG: hypothetical protein LHV69_07655 [Elusimicrobia bacterium]|nr:hypothetical protein [Candidatus Obscuribacterium magneticum]
MKFVLTDSGPLLAQTNMDIDQAELDAMLMGKSEDTVIRFFQWKEPSVSYGHCLNPEKVRDWAFGHYIYTCVRRPTGGGIVLHTTDELSLSLLWLRYAGVLPDNPRDGYKAIHRCLKEGLEKILGQPLTLHERGGGKAKTPKESTMICFQEPVLNDVLWNGRKIVGGAFRMTKKAVLYQGSIQLPTSQIKIEPLKQSLLNSLRSLFQ